MSRNSLRLPELSAPVQLQAASDAIFQTLREAILTRELPPDTHLTEAFLAKQFGVSTTPIRESLHRLIHAGLAVRQTARGVKVRRMTEREVRDIYELRAQLETMALRQSIPNLTEADLDAIERTLAQAKQAMMRQDLKEASRLNSRFHSQIIKGAENQLLLEWLETLSDWRRMIALQEWEGEDRSQTEADEHHAILERIRARDIAGSVALLSRHIAHFL